MTAILIHKIGMFLQKHPKGSISASSTYGGEYTIIVMGVLPNGRELFIMDITDTCYTLYSEVWNILDACP